MQRLAALSLALMLAAVGCSPAAVVYIASPYQRYDHNRTRGVLFKGLSEREPQPLDDTVYTPFRNERFPAGVFVPGDSAPDALEAARLVPVFPGLPLPLSAETPTGARSDRDDLLDFLAAGPLANVGVEPKPTPGELPGAAATRYAPILDLLQSPSLLAGGRAAIVKWAEARKIESTEWIVDPRYHPENSLPAGLGLRHEHFWFVLFPTPKRPDQFSRLVVVPIHPHGQPFLDKAL